MGASSTMCESFAMDLAARAREAETVLEFRRHALGVFSELIGCENSVFVDPASQEPLTTLNVDSSDLRVIEHCERNLGRYGTEVAKVVETAVRVRGILDYEVFSAHQRSRLSFYAEVVQAQKIDSMLILVPQWRGRFAGMLRLQRCSAPKFRRGDLEVAMRLLPTLEVCLAAQRSARPARASLPLLSRREEEIAFHISCGLTTPQIAVLLGTSKLTVRNQIGRIFEKLGISSRAELAAWVTRHDVSV